MSNVPKLKTKSNCESLAAPNGPNRLGFRKMLYADQRLTETDVRAAGGISDLFNADRGYAWASLDYLSRATGCHVRSIKRSVRKLHQLGIIKNNGGGRGRTNEYHPAFPPKPYDVPFAAGGGAWGPYTSWYGAASLVEQPGAEVSLGRRSGVPSEGAEVSPQTTTNLRSETKQVSSSPSGSAAPSGAPPVGGDGDTPSNGDAPGYVEFLAIYPPCIHKPNPEWALAAYKAALDRGVPPALLLAKASQYAAEAKGFDDPKWVKRPGAWLDERWYEKESYGRAPRAVKPAWHRGTYVLGFSLRSSQKKDDWPGGVYIEHGHPNSPLSFDDADLHESDIIVQVNGKVIKTPEQVRKYVDMARADGDSSVEMMVKRIDYLDDECTVEHVTVPLPALDAPAWDAPPEKPEMVEVEPVVAEVEAAKVEPAPPAPIVVPETAPPPATPEPEPAPVVARVALPLTPERIAELCASNDFG